MNWRPSGGSTANEVTAVKDRSPGTRERLRNDQNLPATSPKGTGFAETIKRQFRHLMESLTRRAFAPQRRPSGFFFALQMESHKLLRKSGKSPWTLG